MTKREFRLVYVVVVGALLLISSGSFGLFVAAQEAALEPTSVTVVGSIVDNYANVTYQLVFDNTGSNESIEVDWTFGLQEGIRLSNMSVVIGNETLWGRAMPEQEAVEIYNESVEHNETAVLVVRVFHGYQLRMNVQNNTLAVLTVYVEGLLTRRMGLYSLELPISTQTALRADFDLDFTVTSDYGSMLGYSVRGLPGFTATDLGNGVRLEYSASGLFIPSELAIDYTLDRQLSGSQLLTHTNGTDNFFVYMLAPSITEIEDRQQRQYVFVLDISGSMGGQKIEQSKVAFSSMISTLASEDLFNIVTFNEAVATLWTEPHSASAANVQYAQNWVSGLSAGGSTNFHGAAITGLDTFTVGDNVKAMLILSDGLPTAGTIQDTPGILSAISEGNTLEVSISTVAFGSGADENLLSNIATQNSGFFTFIQPDEDAATELMDFYGLFATPIADDYSIEIQGADDVSSLMPLADSPFFNGTEIVISGRWTESIEINTTIDYVTGTEYYHNEETVADSDKPHIEFIWAHQRISNLVQAAVLETTPGPFTEQVVELAMQYGLIVEGFTALILTSYEQGDTTGEYYAAPTATAPGAPYYAQPPPALDVALFPLLISVGIGILAIAIVVPIWYCKRKSSV
jgi:Ca-activated chloride channel family protein